MSCVGFWTESQRRRLRLAALDPRPVSKFLSPVRSASKRQRIQLLAHDPRPEIRESAALHTDDEAVLRTLAGDVEASVRAAVARNRRSPHDIREQLRHDSDAVVRGWAAWVETATNASGQTYLADSNEGHSEGGQE